MSAGWTLRPMNPDVDKAGLLKLWRDASGYDAGVPVMTESELDALLDHPMSEGGKSWRVAVASNNAVVGALEVRMVGTLRTQVSVAVNPAWRGRGVGRALIDAAPAGRRLLVTTRASVASATTLAERSGFAERYRTVRLRHPAEEGAFDPPKLPSWARIQEDPARETLRFIAAARVVFGPEEPDDPRYVAAYLQRPGVRVLYLRSPKGDDGICVLGPHPQVKKSELKPGGAPMVGLIERVALSKATRGKGVSRPLVRAGLRQLVADGYQELEVTADKRKQAAVDLYLQEGFEVVDEDIHWIRKE